MGESTALAAEVLVFPRVLRVPRIFRRRPLATGELSARFRHL